MCTCKGILCFCQIMSPVAAVGNDLTNLNDDQKKHPSSLEQEFTMMTLSPISRKFFLKFDSKVEFDSDGYFDDNAITEKDNDCEDDDHQQQDDFNFSLDTSDDDDVFDDKSEESLVYPCEKTTRRPSSSLS